MIATVALLHLYIVASSQDVTCQDKYPAESMLQIKQQASSSAAYLDFVEQGLLVENQAEVFPGCSVHKTEAKPQGNRRREGGITISAAKHNLNCGKDKVMTHWVFKRSPNQQDIYFEYTCCYVGGGVTRQPVTKLTSSEKATGWIDPDSLSWFVNLKAVNCSSDAYIQGWRVVQNGKGNETQIEYWCAKPNFGIKTCSQESKSNSDESGPGSGELVWMDRQKWASCPEGEFLSSWDVYPEATPVSSLSPLGNIRTKRTCCSAHRTAAPTPAPTQPRCTTCELKFNNLTENPFNATVDEFATFAAGKVMRFSRACSHWGTDLDLVITLSDYTGKQSKNRIVGDMYELNVKQGTEVTLDMVLEQSEGLRHVYCSVPTVFSVLDVDKHGSAAQTVETQDFQEVKKGAKVSQVGNLFTSLREGTAADNPTDPMDLSDEAKSSTVSFKSKYGYKYGRSGNCHLKVKLAVGGSAPYGRSFFLGGATNLMNPGCESE